MCRLQSVRLPFFGLPTSVATQWTVGRRFSPFSLLFLPLLCSFAYAFSANILASPRSPPSHFRSRPGEFARTHIDKLLRMKWFPLRALGVVAGIFVPETSPVSFFCLARASCVPLVPPLFRGGAVGPGKLLFFGFDPGGRNPRGAARECDF